MWNDIARQGVMGQCNAMRVLAGVSPNLVPSRLATELASHRSVLNELES